MSDALLLTGGTGFLGMELIARLLEAEDGPDIFLAVRGDAEARIGEILGCLYDEPPEAADRLRPLHAELTESGLGLSANDRVLVAREVSRVVHCAASISFTLPLDEARAINVGGTRRVLELARELPALERFVHVSTAYVSGDMLGVFSEVDVGGAQFRNTYEQTKLEAELAVTAADDLPSVVVRPSIVVGESDSGWTSAFNVLYWPLQAFARGVLREVPADPDGVVDMVPVDYVAEVIEHAVFEPGLAGRIHAVAADQSLSVAELIDLVCSELNRKPPVLTEPGSLPPDHPARAFAPYFDVKTRFESRRVPPAPDPRDYLRALLDYGRAARWGKTPLSREAARALQTTST
jgi:long-chain acyl-CoA synthetase